MITFECGDNGCSLRPARLESILFRDCEQRRVVFETCLDNALEAAAMNIKFSRTVKENEYGILLSALAFIIYTMTLEPFPDVDALEAARELITVIEKQESFTICYDNDNND